MSNMLKGHIVCFVAAMALVVSSVSAQKIRKATVLADDGKAFMSVVVSTNATDKVHKTAEDLVSYLGRMADAEFKVVEADGRKGIAVGTAADFGVLVPDSTFDVNDVKRREEYLLRSHKQGVFLIGATDMAVENAVWDFLYRLGYRQFFPGKNWEVIPRIKHLSVCLDVREKPDYLARDIWYGHGPWDYHLRLGASPCIGTGTNLAELADTDLDGNPRIVPDNGRVDMGCYETPEPSGSVILIK